MKIIMTIALYVLLTMSSVADAKGRATPPPELGTLKGAEAEAFYLGVNAAIWGYPIVFFEDLIRGRTRPDAEAKTGNPQAQINEFALVRQLRGPEFKAIATPNNDTLYAQAFTDVSREPMVLSVPEVEADRYYTMQLWDPNGDTFAYVGSRTTGVKAGDFALVGPDWKGNLPPDVKRIDSEYNSLVIWGRIGVKGSDDVKNANKIQDKLRLTPLSQFQEMKNSGQEIAVDKTFSMQRVAYTKPADLAPWPVSNGTGVIGTSFTTDRVLSSSFCPKVAAVHACYHEPHTIWVMTVVTDLHTKGVVFNDTANEKMGHEREIAFSKGLTLKCIEEQKIHVFTVLSVEFS
ncbi:DUF1254 domain-containing protein [Shewanella psychropiezotolerans]|uniref:DUF1254 domain-containing protein n=1 Tax=Shewanella psychropiezotolerans TaxID=2593655 RepID=A0ABX5X432_9GAMM|nr:DUF1254 domain-containing protein [Shewanella psychropiezotolerans]QDO85192.1 DUF1254 domain-containing protein [Shewanella psychropiezotolerans]